jgi:acyl-CoA thioesterase FadM
MELLNTHPNVYTSKQILVLKTHITFVHIDEEGNPIPINDNAKDMINKLINNIQIS